MDQGWPSLPRILLAVFSIWWLISEAKRAFDPRVRRDALRRWMVWLAALAFAFILGSLAADWLGFSYKIVMALVLMAIASGITGAALSFIIGLRGGQ